MPANTAVSSALAAMNGAKKRFSVYSIQAPLTYVLACVRLRFPGSYEAVGYIEFDICIEMLHMRFDLQEILPDQPNLLHECPGFELPFEGKSG